MVWLLLDPTLYLNLYHTKHMNETKSADGLHENTNSLSAIRLTSQLIWIIFVVSIFKWIGVHCYIPKQYCSRLHKNIFNKYLQATIVLIVCYGHQHAMQGTSIICNLGKDPYNDTVALYSVLGISVSKDKQVRKREEGKDKKRKPLFWCWLSSLLLSSSLRS